MILRAIVAVVLLAVLAPPADAATRQCPGTPGSNCKGDSGGWWPDHDDVMRLGAGTGTATVCRHRHAVPYASYCYELSSTCSPQVAIPMRRHSDPSRDGWGSVMRKINRGGWCVAACAVVNVPPWAPWTKIPGTDYVESYTILVDLHDVDDPDDDEYEDRERDCWQEDRECTEPVSPISPCSGGPYCFLPSPQNRTKCGSSRVVEPPLPPQPCTAATYQWGSWLPVGACPTGTGGTSQTRTESCTPGTGICTPAACGPLIPPQTRECGTGGGLCTTPAGCGSGKNTCAPGTVDGQGTAHTPSDNVYTWSCTPSDPNCSTLSCDATAPCSAFRPNTPPTCVCDAADTETCTTTCTNGTCQVGGTCPSQYPMVTTTPNSSNCVNPPGVCGPTEGSCLSGNASAVTPSPPCSARTVSGWGAYVPAPGTQYCDGDQVSSKTCTPGMPGQKTWNCTTAGGSAACSVPDMSCNYDCSTPPIPGGLERTRTIAPTCPCPASNLRPCDGDQNCPSGVGDETIDDGRGLGSASCKPQSCTYDGCIVCTPSCTPTWDPPGDGSTICAPDSASGTEVCVTGVSGTPCPTTTRQLSQPGTRTTNCRSTAPAGHPAR